MSKQTKTDIRGELAALGLVAIVCISLWANYKVGDLAAKDQLHLVSRAQDDVVPPTLVVPTVLRDESTTECITVYQPQHESGSSAFVPCGDAMPAASRLVPAGTSFLDILKTPELYVGKDK